MEQRRLPETVKEGIAMNYLTGFCVMVFFCAMASAKEPMLEWRLKCMEREIPGESKESLREASDYRKHKEDFKEKLSVASYTCGFTAAAVKASLLSPALAKILSCRHRYAGLLDEGIQHSRLELEID
jgi:hypothetical protein